MQHKGTSPNNRRGRSTEGLKESEAPESTIRTGWNIRETLESVIEKRDNKALQAKAQHTNSAKLLPHHIHRVKTCAGEQATQNETNIRERE